MAFSKFTLETDFGVPRQGFINDNTGIGRKTACAKLFSVREPEQQTVAYVRENIEAIKTRFQNLNKDVRGGTVDEYARRALFAVNDYMKWMADRGAWEREAGSRGGSKSDGDKKAKGAKAANKAQVKAAAVTANDNTRIVTIPIRPGFEITIVVPKDLKIGEVRRLAYVLAGYASDFDPMNPGRSIQALLDFKEAS